MLLLPAPGPCDRDEWDLLHPCAVAVGPAGYKPWHDETATSDPSLFGRTGEADPAELTYEQRLPGGGWMRST
jgi:hypothetical protein